MAFIDEIIRIETELTENRSNPTELCALAGIDRSTWSKWKSNPDAMPTMRLWKKVEGALEKIKSELAA